MLKTITIVESHWREGKHACLHRFNRPHIYVILILKFRPIPLGLNQMKAVLVGDPRKRVVSKRKAFKKPWKQLQDHTVSSNSRKKIIIVRQSEVVVVSRFSRANSLSISIQFTAIKRLRILLSPCAVLSASGHVRSGFKKNLSFALNTELYLISDTTLMKKIQLWIS